METTRRNFLGAIGGAGVARILGKAVAPVAAVAIGVEEFVTRRRLRREVAEQNADREAQYQSEIVAISRGVQERVAGVYASGADVLRYFIDRADGGAEWREDELSENRQFAHQLALSRSGDEFVFCDQNGRVIEIIQMPSNLQFPNRQLSAAEKEALHLRRQVWIDMQRKRIIGLHPTVRMSVYRNNSEPRVYPVLAASETPSYLEVVWGNANETVETGQTRIEFAKQTLRRIFTQEDLINAETGQGSDSFNFERLIDLIVYGLAGVESQFNTDTDRSHAGARGVWQFMPDSGYYKIRVPKRGGGYEERIVPLVRDETVSGRDRRGRKTRRTRRVDERMNFRRATEAVAYYFVDLYKGQRDRNQRHQPERGLRHHPDVKYLIQTYHLSPEDLVIPLMINAYNAGNQYIIQLTDTIDGDPDTHAMLRWFRENFTPERVRQYLGQGPYGENLYAFMSMAYARAGQSGLYNASYGPDTREYYFKVAALASLMKEKERRVLSAARQPQGQRDPIDTSVCVEFNGQYREPLSPPQRPPERPRMLRVQGWGSKRTVMEISAAAAGVLIAERSLCSLGGAVESTQVCTRRAFFGKVADLVRRPAVAIPVAIATSHALGNGLADTVTDITPPSIESQLAQEATQTTNLPQPNESMRSDAIAMIRKLRVKNLKDSEHRRLAINRKVDGDRRLNPYMVAWSKAVGLSVMETEADVVAFNGTQRGLKQISEVTRSYRCVQIGTDDNDDRDGNDDRDRNRDRNRSEYMHVFAPVERMLDRVYEEINFLAERAGMPQQYRIRPVVTSLVRSQEYQNRIRTRNRQAARGETSHKFRNTVDFSLTRFDIIGVRREEYVELRNVPKLQALLVRALRNLSLQGELAFLVEHTKEGGPVTCHTMTMAMPEAA